LIASLPAISPCVAVGGRLSVVILGFENFVGLLTDVIQQAGNGTQHCGKITADCSFIILFASVSILPACPSIRCDLVFGFVRLGLLRFAIAFPSTRFRS
jgi:hypothetical protein